VASSFEKKSKFKIVIISKKIFFKKLNLHFLGYLYKLNIKHLSLFILTLLLKKFKNFIIKIRESWMWGERGCSWEILL